MCNFIKGIHFWTSNWHHESRMATSIGSFKDFRVLETIGKGSFASVYKVRPFLVP